MSKRTDDVYLVSRVALAVLAGASSYFAYPKPGLWPVIFASVTLLFVSVRGTTAPRAGLIGFLGGFAFFASQCWWISQYLGPIPLIALAISQALFVSLAMALYATTERAISSAWMQALMFASIWTAREWVTTHFPYGGFPWSRLAMSQAFSPLAGWVYFGGFSLLSFVIALTSTMLVIALPRLKRKSVVVLMASTLAILFAVPLLRPTIDDGKNFKIAGIQGNANAGLFANTTPGEILGNHLDVTKAFLKSGKNQGVGLVVWPENASDLNPLDNNAVAAVIDNLVNQKLGVPLAFGTLTHQGNKEYNSSLLWKPGEGLSDQYDKKRPVPFAEFVPDRDFWYPLAPDLIGLIYRGYTFGTRDPIFEVDNNRFGVLICFEIAIDESLQSLVDSGAQAILLQSNNADFGHSDEAYQQQAVARLRAIETGLPLMNVSTTGPSSIFSATGATLANVNAFEPRYLVSNIKLRTSDTPAMGIGRHFDALNLAVLVTWLLLLSLRRRKVTRD